MQTKQDVIQWLEDNRERFIAMSDDIWAHPEIRWEEYRASKLQADFLADEGFTVWSIEEMPTAFIAEYGQGQPIIGFAGEYDALPGLSQKAQPTREPVEEGGLGHGCGHNLLGVGCLAPAVVIKEWLESTGIQGTVRYYGCPAEEGGSAKAYMARAGAFDDLDVAFNFHPSSFNMAQKDSCVAIVDTRFRFHGRTSHAGGSPHLGRSALDAVELMNVGVNYLREHVTPNVRMHYVITEGGQAPNIVPDLAEVWYYLRAPQVEELQEVIVRVNKIAEGAALMTETTLEIVPGRGSVNVLNNHCLADLQYAAMDEVGAINFTEEEMSFAQRITDEYPTEMFEDSVKDLTGTYKIKEEIARKPLISQNTKVMDVGVIRTGSTDVGDMSWCVPLSMLRTACFPLAAPGHSWGNAATSGMSIGHKGMMHAAKIMALAAMDCYSDPTYVQKAREEFEKTIQKRPYKSLLQEDVAKADMKSVSSPDSLPERYPQFPFYDRNKR